MERNAIEAVLTTMGRKEHQLLIREMKVGEVHRALVMAGGHSGLGGLGVEASQSLLKFSIVEIDGRKVGFAELDGGGLEQFLPKMRLINQAFKAWGQLHLPSIEEQEGCEGSLKELEDGRWSVILPSTKCVIFREVGLQTIGQILKHAQKSARSPAAQSWDSYIESGLVAIDSVDGRAVKLSRENWDEHLSVKDTWAFGAIWAQLHSGEDDWLGK